MSGGFPLGFEVCNGNDAGSVTTTSLGTTVVCSSANTYGSYTQLVASTPYDTQWININVGYNASGYTAAFKIAVGASGSEIDIIKDIVVQFGPSNNFCFPISIPAGTRISAACVAGIPDNVRINLTLYDGAFTQMEGIAGVDSIGFGSSQGTTITSSATANVKGSYTQLTASTPRDYRGFFISIDGQQMSFTSQQLMVDIAVGGSGSEVVILPNLPIFGSPIVGGLFPIPIPAGTRVSARSQATGASTVIGLTLYGLYQ